MCKLNEGFLFFWVEGGIVIYVVVEWWLVRVLVSFVVLVRFGKVGVYLKVFCLKSFKNFFSDIGFGVVVECIVFVCDFIIGIF